MYSILEPILNFIRVNVDETDNLSVLCQMNNRRSREEIRAKGKGYYHFCTDGLKTGNLFYSAAQFSYGMILIGLLALKYSLKIYAFVLMPNHIHIVLSGTGENCLKAFDYFKYKVSLRLKKDGYSPLPDDYGFILKEIPDKDSMKSELAYVLRNPLEKDYSTIAGYVWGTGWLYHSGISVYISGKRVDEMSKREVTRLTGTELALPGHWRLHPDLGLLPGGFVDTSLVKRLFPAAKDFEVAMVKDFESFVRTARALNEDIEFSMTEIKSIVNLTLQNNFKGKSLSELTQDAKCKLAVILGSKYGLTPYEISQGIYLKESIVRQVISAKEYRKFTQTPAI